MMRLWMIGVLLVITIKNNYGQDLTEGLIGYYSFCGCEATDYSGNGNDATIIGAPECIEGIKGEGFLFNESGGNTGCSTVNTDFIQLPEFGAIWQDGISICAWVEYKNIANFERIVDIGNGNGDNGGLPVWFGREGNSDNLTLESWINSDPNANRTTGRLVAVDAITNGQIEFYCATIAGDSMKIYVNGVLAAQKAGHPIRNVSRNANYIGRSNWCNADPDFHGFMDEVRIYNRALSAEEILQMYEAPFFATPPVVGICEGGSIQLEAQGGTAYEWTPSANLSADDVSSPIASPPVTTTYRCKIIFPDGCFITDSVLVEVERDTLLRIDTTICSNEDYFGYSSTGTYTDVFTTKYGCDSTRILNLSVVPNPTLNESISICEGENYRGYDKTGVYEEALFSDSGCDTLYQLSLSVSSPQIDQLNISPSECAKKNGRVAFELSDDTRPVIAYLNGDAIDNPSTQNLATGTYTLDLVDEAGCSTDTTLIIPQAVCPLYIPSAFSPNGDGRNDRFQIYCWNEAAITIRSFRIYNRWGGLIFEAEDFSVHDTSISWDGTFQGQPLNNGTYLYTVVAEYDNGKVSTLQGTVQLTP